MNREVAVPQRTSLAEVRQIVTQLNRIDYEKADYTYLLEQVGKLICGIPMEAHTVPQGTLLFRGVCHQEKPHQTSLLGHPPAEKVTGYQRCNAPGKPMLYASVDKIAIFSEINPEPGSKVYLSKWIVEKEFFYFRIPPNASEEWQNDPAFSKVETLFETRFIQPVHQTFSTQYKLTAAIAEKLSSGSISSTNPDHKEWVLGGVVYPSVAHTGRSDNIAIQPTVVQSCLRLQDVLEMEVLGRDEGSWTVQSTDFSAEFNHGEIFWTGRTPQWTLGPGEQMTFTAENQEWVARRLDGSIIHPS
ncbi:hypothetical protein NK214_06165 [Chromobacterium sp. S0633]|uniref:hypothetical protein n=1 Tax=Chromobacterium sp. S0633 TaxID=2957805 RepID=UPI00209ECAAC|nr:hypothetical protein [Chromobacterium sp. S0633]MCP1289772.1 hypothetical protein [Chromobacterium sp. S0633]